MNEITMRKADRLIDYLRDYHNFSFYRFQMGIDFYYYQKTLDYIEEMFPQIQLWACINIEDMNIRFTIFSIKTQNILGQIDIQCGENVYDALCRIIRFCDDCTEQHILPKNNGSIQSHHCTSCGAALKRNSYKCEYCDTEYW